jgi:acyl-CoA synthetase (AMP-forming)/AMP-acid ligase II
MAEPQNLYQLLKCAANGPQSSGITTFNTAGDQSQRSKFTSYKALFDEAEQKSFPIRGLINLNKNNIVLLHVDNHEDGIVWFWAIIAAAGVPCMSTPFSKDEAQRVKHLRSLSQLLNKPTIITGDHLLSEFEGLNQTPAQTLWSFTHIDQEHSNLGVIANITDETCHPALSKKSNDVGVLMLTSGSTGASVSIKCPSSFAPETLFNESENIFHDSYSSIKVEY